MNINHHPFLIVVSSPSGAGKSTLCHMIVKNDPLVKLSISYTTRKKREGEIDGKHYFFVDDNRFKKMEDDGDFLESAKVFNHSYGTPKKIVESELKNSHCILFDIDWQGARQIKEKFSKKNILTIFILPPSLKELERRLRSRAQDSEKVVQERMKKACSEISHYKEYDYLIVNDELNLCYQKICSIIEAKRVINQNKKDISNLIQQFFYK